MNNKLINLANYLDSNGFEKEAGSIDFLIRKKSDRKPIGSVEKYIKHTALNLGMVSRNLAFLDKKSLKVRLEELANDLYYAIIPPWTHHDEEELQDMARHTVLKWFMCGLESDEEYAEACMKNNPINLGMGS